jgi:hypothetical protein
LKATIKNHVLGFLVLVVVIALFIHLSKRFL